MYDPCEQFDPPGIWNAYDARVRETASLAYNEIKKFSSKVKQIGITLFRIVIIIFYFFIIIFYYYY